MKKTNISLRFIFLLFSFLTIPCSAENIPSQPSSEIPRWLAESETYGFSISNLDIVTGTNWKFITHCPHDETFLREARLRGVRTFPYVTFYQFPLDRTYQNIRLSDHPEWILINEKGQWTRTGFWESEDQKNWYCSCPNVKGFVDACLAQVETLMQRGASGIFVDNIVTKQTCHGPKFGKHQHLFDSQLEAFADLLRRARLIIKKYDPDGAILINSANPPTLPRIYWPVIDCEMSESYICTWVSKTRWGDWQRSWNGIDKKIPPGKQVCTLSYLGHTTNSLKDDLYFCYCSSRLMNFIWSGGHQHNDNPEARKIYSLQTGSPVSAEKVLNKVHYRLFQNALVTVNPTDDKKDINIADTIPTAEVLDLYNNQYIPVTKIALNLNLPPQSGRIFLYKPSPESENNKITYTLTIKTTPPLGKTWFEVDGLPFITHSGRWKIDYEKGARFGSFQIIWDQPGWHTINVIDEVKKELLIPTSYGTAYKINDLGSPDDPNRQNRPPERLGKLMDPAQPGKLPSGKPYKFTHWSGPLNSSDKQIKIYVDKNMTVCAEYDQQ